MGKINDPNQRRHILTFFAKYGSQPTLDAFGVPKTTIYRWKNLTDLRNLSRRPLRLRKPQWTRELVRRVIRWRGRGWSADCVAHKVGISISTVYRICKYPRIVQ